MTCYKIKISANVISERRPGANNKKAKKLILQRLICIINFTVSVIFIYNKLTLVKKKASENPEALKYNIFSLKLYFWFPELLNG